MLQPAVYREAFQRDVAAIAAAARQDLDAVVPSCPGWTVAILVGHLTGIYAHRAVLARTRATTNRNWSDAELGLPEAFTPFFDFVFDESTPITERTAPNIPSGLVDLFERTAADLVETLWDLDASTPIWTWLPTDQTAGFWQRRMTHETVIHRWDTELAYGLPQPPETIVATDGIDEVLNKMVTVRRAWAAGPVAGSGEIYHFHRTDGPGEWLLRCDPAGPELTREHAKGDVALRGSGSDLFLWLWHRISTDTLEVFGDATLLKRFFELFPPD